MTDDSGYRPLTRRERRRLRKARRRRTAAVVALFLALLLGGGAGGVMYVGSHAGWFDGPVASEADGDAKPTDYAGDGYGGYFDYTVRSGASASTIGPDLERLRVIADSDTFIRYVAESGAESKVQQGTFRLRLHMSDASVLEVLTDPSRATGYVEVRPGDRAADVMTRAAAAAGVDASVWTSMLSNPSAAGLPADAGGSYEGWLEPGRYDVKGREPAQVLGEMVGARVDRLSSLGVPVGQREDLLRKASIIESEVNSRDYYGKVARVIENRLARGMPLGMDTVIAYGAGVNALQLTKEQLADAGNAYNDRIHTGLPPTPISNPGTDALQAALHPEDGDWLYFVTVNLETGETKFTADKSQFEEYASEYER